MGNFLLCGVIFDAVVVGLEAAALAATDSTCSSICRSVTITTIRLLCIGVMVFAGESWSSIDNENRQIQSLDCLSDKAYMIPVFY